jgi:hypothetical protein
MAEFGYPMESGAGAVVSEDQWGLMSRWWMQPGVYLEYLNGLEVYADSTGRQVKVRTGGAWAYGAMYLNTAEVILPIAVNAGATRIDSVVVRFQWTTDQVFLFVVAGTPGGGPPSLAASPGFAWDLELARITVATGFVTLAGGTVENRRVNAVPRVHDLLTEHRIASQPVGYPLRTVAGSSSATPNSAYGFGAIGDAAIDASLERRNLLLNGGFEHKSRSLASANTTSQYFHDGWYLSVNAGESLLVQDVAGTISPDSLHAAYCTVTAAGGGGTQYLQDLRLSPAGASTGGRVEMRGHSVSLSGLVYQNAVQANGARLFMNYNGTGGGTVFSAYHTSASGVELLTIGNLVIPSDATLLQVGVQFMAGAGIVYIIDSFNLVLGQVPTYYAGLGEAEEALNCRARYQRVPSIGQTLAFSGYNASLWDYIVPIPLMGPMAQAPTVSIATAFATTNANAPTVAAIGRDHIQFTCRQNTGAPNAWAANSGVIVCESNPT